jgi:hypothetical protein
LDYPVSEIPDVQQEIPVPPDALPPTMNTVDMATSPLEPTTVSGLAGSEMQEFLNFLEIPELNDTTHLPEHNPAVRQPVQPTKRNHFVSRSFLVILRTWAQKCKIPATQMDLLTKLLRNNSKYFEFATLPKSWKTVVRIKKTDALKTHYNVEEWGTAKNRKRYCYVGVEKRLTQYMHLYVEKGSRGKQKASHSQMQSYASYAIFIFTDCDDEPPHFEIVVNVDGGKFGTKGVMASLWPIQIQVWAVVPRGIGNCRRVLEGGNPPHIVGIHHAQKQPKDFSKYLMDFALEMIRLDPNQPVEEGNERRVTCTLVAAICDTPARRKCKCAKGANAIFPCEKCMSLGTKVGKFFTSIWDTDNLELRTDDEFLTYNLHLRTEINPITKEVEVAKSPLLKLGYFGMVTGFPVEPMHTVYHCAVKNWLKKLFEGARVAENAFPNAVKRKMENLLLFFKNFTPSEFRSSQLKLFDHLKDWKAAESKHFIDYPAIMLFRRLADKETYESVCDLVVALYLIGGASSKPVPSRDLDSAENLISKFVNETLQRNFSESCPPTAHFLLHIVEDLRFHKCHLERLGAWPFENAMRFVLDSVKCGNRAVEQIFNREDERLCFALPVDIHGVITSTTPIAGNYYSAKNKEKTEPYLEFTVRGKKSLIYPKSRGGFVLKTTKNNRDCHFIYQHGTNRKKDIVIVKFLDVVQNKDRTDGPLMIVGQAYRCMRILFTKPCSSARFYGYEFKDLDPIKREFVADNVIGKMYAYPNVSELNSGNSSTEQVGLLKFLNCTLPVDSPKAPEVPDFTKLCQQDFSAWEGIAIRHTISGGSSLY